MELFSSSLLWCGASPIQNVISLWCIFITNLNKGRKKDPDRQHCSIRLNCHSQTESICLHLYLVFTFFLLSPSLCPAPSSLLHPHLSLSVSLWRTFADRTPCYCSDPKDGPTEEGYGFHKALSSINFSQSKFSTWLNIIPGMLWCDVRWSENTMIFSDDKFVVVINDRLTVLLQQSKELWQIYYLKCVFLKKKTVGPLFYRDDEKQHC